MKPIRGDLYLDYRCDKCATIHQVSLKEVQKIGKILCFCGKLLKLTPFKVQMRLDYQVQTEKKPKVKASPIKKSASDDVIMAMVALGYKKDMAKRIVESFSDDLNDDELLKECLKCKI